MSDEVNMAVAFNSMKACQNVFNLFNGITKRFVDISLNPCIYIHASLYSLFGLMKEIRKFTIFNFLKNLNPSRARIR